jgi:hypothetical protein
MLKKLVVLIPTRNRSDFAKLAADSALTELDRQPIRIVISDNSTEQAHSAALDAYLATLDNDPITLIRPASCMAMAMHWEWAINTAIKREQPSHLLVLTDRMAFRRGCLHSVLNTVRRHPDDIVSYTYDRIDDYSLPVRYVELPRTGDTFRISTSELLSLSAQMKFYSFLPRLLNCVVPISTLDKIRDAHGSICASVAPDYCFCYRALDAVESIVYLDYSTMINFGQDRSNGASFGRGLSTRDSTDFVKTTGEANINALTPLPQIRTIGNAIIHEYLAAKQESRSGKFPTLASGAYLKFLGIECLKFVNANQRKEGLQILRSEGMPQGLGFRWNALQHSIEILIKRTLSKRFSNFATAFQYAKDHPPRKKPYLKFILRRYQIGKLESSTESGAN